MNAPQGDAITKGASLYPESYMLQALDLFNWGPFGGRHHVAIDRRGTAIIGATGSGKTTLVDALMTLICERPKYNLASTGGHESDRDWISYVRGKSGEGNAVDDSHIARPGKTISSIAATFADAQRQVMLAGIFWLEGSSSSQSDLKRIWIFDQGATQDIDDLLERFDQGGYRALKQHEKQTPALSVTNSKKAYLAQVQRFFGVGENAFTLLNRAAGMKQINSIDELFRELVLEDSAAFERAAEVVKGFDTLTNIREELLIARRQYDSLLPIRAEAKRHANLLTRKQDRRRLRDLLPIAFAEHRHRVLSERSEALDREIENLRHALAEMERRHDEARRQADALQTAYLKSGGGDVEHLKELIRKTEEERDKVSVAARDYQHMMRDLQLDERLETTVFHANQALVAERRERLQATLEEQQGHLDEAIGTAVELQRRKQALEEELAQVRARPASNIPTKQDRFRQALALHLGLAEDELPFLAELVEVQAEQARWRGAIERAIGADRLRILVPESVIEEALRWVNQRDNRLDVRLLRVKASQERAEFLPDGFVRKLNFKPHPHREAAKVLLARKDLHCVDSPEALRDTPHALTQEGMTSGRRGYFEKRDSTPLTQNWMTGFDNRDRLAQLQGELERLAAELVPAEAARREMEQGLDRLRQEASRLAALQDLTFDEVDVSRLDRELEQWQQGLERLLNPESDTEKARRRWEAARDEAAGMSEALNEKRVQIKYSRKEHDELERRRRRAAAQVGEGLDEEQRQWLATQLPAAPSDDLETLDDQERGMIDDTDAALVKLEEQIRRSENTLVRQMEKAQKEDTGALSEVGTELQDISDYCARLEVLEREALPEKEQRFLDYLNESSDQSVTQLLAGVNNEVTIIEERIEELNETMNQVDFQPGRYLRLDTQAVVHESIRTLDRAQKHLRAARLNDDKGESHYQALRKVVELVRDAAENRRKVGSRALLDPRYRLQFKAAVVERDGHRVVNSFSGSQGGSGGEKEIIASYILTASLSYALCPPGSQRPLFGTIVLDEAFSKSSQAVAGRIVSALRQFGLHPLFVTPNKEMQLLRTHTRSAVLIHRKGYQATTTNLSWEELREKAEGVRRQRQQAASSLA